MRKVYFRVDANHQIGYGHFVRCLSLADILKDEFDCYFVSQNPTQYQLDEIAKVGKFIPIPNESNPDEYFLSILLGDEIVVLDGYYFNLNFQKSVRAKAHKLVYIDDRQNEIYATDLLVNHVIGTKEDDITVIDTPNLILVGPKYALLRSAFRVAMSQRREYNNESREILIAMGGTDYYDITGRIIDLFPTKYSFTINVLLGDSYKYSEKLTNHNVTIYRNLSDSQLVDLMSRQRMVISPPSTLSYEVCAVGCPLIVGSFTDNHIPVEKLMARYGLAVSCGNFLDLTPSLLEDTIEKVLEFGPQILLRQREVFDGLQGTRLLTEFRKFL